MAGWIIEESVSFDSDEKTLINIQTNESVTLSLLASDILSLLISRHGQVVNREALFAEIFDRRNAAPTNNNLNQYILNLRKQLQFLGLEAEIIQTVPRIGFIIPSSVLIENGQGVVPSQASERPAEVFPQPTTAVQSQATPRMLKAWIGLMLFVTVGAVIYQWRSQVTGVDWNSQPSANAIAVNTNKRCQIFVIPSGIDVQKENIEEYRHAIAEFTPMHCAPSTVTRYYLYQTSDEDEIKRRSFVLKCTQNEHERPSCYSWYRLREK